MKRGALYTKYYLPLTAVILSFIGIILLFSLFGGVGVGLENDKSIRQVLWLLFSLGAFYGVLQIPHSIIIHFSGIFYGLCLVILLLTWVFAPFTRGMRWISFFDIFYIQISEFTKLGFILVLARYLSAFPDKMSRSLFFMGACALFIPVFLLVFVQPDLGTASVYWFVLLGMLFFAQVSPYLWSFIALIFPLTFIILAFAKLGGVSAQNSFLSIILVDAGYFTQFFMLNLGILLGFFGAFLFFKTVYFKIVVFLQTVFISSFIGAYFIGSTLRPYQITRLLVFINPQLDPLGSGWNILQSLTMIGAGGLWGATNLAQELKVKYSYLPETHTDFIFSFLSGQGGFFGTTLFLVLYLFLFWGMLRVLSQMQSSFGRYVGVGIITMFLYHFIINIGMTIGLMPIVGLPLYFISYGGSALLNAFLCLGILLNLSQENPRSRILL